MALIEFENNTDEIIEEMRHKALDWLEEAFFFLQSHVFTIGSCPDCLTVLARADHGSL